MIVNYGLLSSLHALLVRRRAWLPVLGALLGLSFVAGARAVGAFPDTPSAAWASADPSQTPPSLIMPLVRKKIIQAALEGSAPSLQATGINKSSVQVVRLPSSTYGYATTETLTWDQAMALPQDPRPFKVGMQSPSSGASVGSNVTLVVADDPAVIPPSDDTCKATLYAAIAALVGLLLGFLFSRALRKPKI